MSKGRLEALITVPTGGWAFAINDSGAGGDVSGTIAAGDYYLTGSAGFIKAFETALNLAAPTDTFTVVLGNGEGGTGKVSIQSNGNGVLTWTAADLRDLLGWTTNVTLVANVASVAPGQCRALWLPDCDYDAPNELYPWLGWPEVDLQVAESPAGQVFALVGASKEVTDLWWRAVQRKRAVRSNEATVNESFQRFLEDGVWGFASWGMPTGPIRFYPDADLGNAIDFAVVLPDRFRPEKFVDGWAGGPWTCGFERLVVQASGAIAGAVGARATMSVALLEAASSTDGLTGYTTGSATPTASKLQVLDVLSSSGTAAETPTSVVGCGLVWDLVFALNLNVAGTRRLSRYRAVGTAPSTGALTITFLNAMSSCLWNWKEVTGADVGGQNGSNAIVQTVSATAGTGSTTINATLAALEHANNIHLAAVGLSDALAVNADAQFTEVGDDTETTPSSALECQWASETTCDPTFAAASACILSSEIRAAAA